MDPAPQNTRPEAIEPRFASDPPVPTDLHTVVEGVELKPLSGVMPKCYATIPTEARRFSKAAAWDIGSWFFKAAASTPSLSLKSLSHERACAKAGSGGISLASTTTSWHEDINSNLIEVPAGVDFRIRGYAMMDNRLWACAAFLFLDGGWGLK